MTRIGPVCALVTAGLLAAGGAWAVAQTPGQGARAMAGRPQDPAPPFPYSEALVSFANAADGTRLEGTLTLPAGEGPIPAVLLLSGAGAQDRDYTALGHRFYLVLADHLTRHGIAVLRVDDRGAGGSGGDNSRMALADAVGDVRAGLTWLADHARIDATRVGLIAHSEGGRVAPAVADESDLVAFLVLLAPPAVGAEALVAGQAAAAGADPVALAQSALMVMIRQRLRQEPDPDRALADVTAGFEAWLSALPPDQARVMRILWAREPFRQQVRTLVAALGTPWNRSLFSVDPAPALRALDVPTLALYGDRDRQTPPAQQVPALESYWAGHADATIRILPGLNHFFQHAETGLPDEIPRLDETLAPEALEAVREWVRDRTTAR